MPPGRPTKSPKKGTTSTSTTSSSSKTTSTKAEPLLTQQNFEKELHDLATKAHSETPLNWLTTQLLILAQVLLLLCLSATYSTISLLTLSPIYGSYPSAIHHSKLVMSCLFLGWSSNLFLSRQLALYSSMKIRELLPLIAVYIPFTQYFLFKFSGDLGAKMGPTVVEGFTYASLLVLSISCIATLLDDLEFTSPYSSRSGWSSWISDAVPGIASFALFNYVEGFSGTFIDRVIGSSILFTRLGLQIFFAGVYALFAPSKLLLYASLPAILHTALFNIHVPTPYMTANLNSTINAKGWSLIGRRESLTGYISVIEKQGSFRAMRCDHSILGGEWLEQQGEERRSITDPIYGVFVMLEAVRLAERGREKEVDDGREENALVIGLGIGTTPTALLAHNIQTTIIEIDPVVVEFAIKYFGFPSTSSSSSSTTITPSKLKTPEIIIQDAVSYASEIAEKGEKQYDYIVHDVFTGGAEPVDLFTLEFLRDLERVLKGGGVVAINYAADLTLPPARIILNTIFHVFPRSSCRIFRESAPPSPETLAEEGRDFTNMVVFCLKPLYAHFPSQSSHSEKESSEGEEEDEKENKRKEGKGGGLKFRKPQQKDFLGSASREMFLEPRWEVFADEIFLLGGGVGEDKGKGREGEWILMKNGTERFRGWQGESARGHWSVMRGVLPGWIWEGW